MRLTQQGKAPDCSKNVVVDLSEVSPKTPFDDFSNLQIQNLLGEPLVRCASAFAMLPSIGGVAHPPRFASLVEPHPNPSVIVCVALAADLAKARMPPAVMGNGPVTGGFGPSGGVQNNPLPNRSPKCF